MEILYDWRNANKRGIYQMVVDNKHSYIGKTDRHFSERWDEHCRNIYNGKCNNKFKAHISENSTIIFRMVKECHTKKETSSWESLYISNYKPDLNVKKK